MKFTGTDPGKESQPGHRLRRIWSGGGAMSLACTSVHRSGCLPEQVVPNRALRHAERPSNRAPAHSPSRQLPDRHACLHAELRHAEPPPSGSHDGTADGDWGTRRFGCALTQVWGVVLQSPGPSSGWATSRAEGAVESLRLSASGTHAPRVRFLLAGRRKWSGSLRFCSSR